MGVRMGCESVGIFGQLADSWTAFFAGCLRFAGSFDGECHLNQWHRWKMSKVPKYHPFFMEKGRFGTMIFRIFLGRLFALQLVLQPSYSHKIKFVGGSKISKKHANSKYQSFSWQFRDYKERFLWFLGPIRPIGQLWKPSEEPQSLELGW